MNKIRKSIKSLLIVLFAGLFLTSSAQELNDAIKKLHEGLAVINDDPKTAMDVLNDCIALCNEIGPDADETKAEAEMRLPTCCYKIAYQSYENKNIEEALTGFIKTAEVAEKYGDNETKEKTEQYIPKLYYTLAGKEYKNGNLNESINNYKKAIEHDPLYASAFYNMSLLYAKLKDNDNSLVAVEQAIDAAKQSGDSKTLEKATQRAHNLLLKDGSDAKAKGEYTKAIDLLKKAIEYDASSVDAYYLIAQSYNKLEKWDNAIEAAQKSLENESGNDEKKARVYYEIATSQLGKGDNEAACESYKNALYGAYLESAKYQIEIVLKCK